MRGNVFGKMHANCNNPRYANIGTQPGFQDGTIPIQALMLHAHNFDQLTPSGKIKVYKEGGAATKFDTFNGTDDRMKTLTFLEQFDAAFIGWNFGESSKVQKAAMFLKGNALQWWTTLVMRRQAPSTWVEFEQPFSFAWLTNTFEVDVMTAWHRLDASKCEDLEEYT
ncbi:hypothetical protein KP509_25G056200 [Ceratopteris richardii]|uniref:Retrotransposon gag domain-containing protein n=1 Tax=Ceratopteris richardii TaxID=49495 RepID=A0A8T2RQF3_CERRI|nr:hypothetical protein KP509_25G056200 [Ceratopteris richardii]